MVGSTPSRVAGGSTGNGDAGRVANADADVGGSTGTGTGAVAAVVMDLAMITVKDSHLGRQELLARGLRLARNARQ